MAHVLGHVLLSYLAEATANLALSLLQGLFGVTD
jgi:hypothetical protein